MAYFNNEDYKYKQEQNKKKNEIEKTINFILKKLDDKFKLTTILFECDYINEIDFFIQNSWKNLKKFTDENNNTLNVDMSYDYFVKQIKDYLKSKYKFFKTDKCVRYNKPLSFWGKKFESFSNIEIRVYSFIKEDKKNLYHNTPERLEKRIKREEELLKIEKEKLEKEKGNKNYKKDSNSPRINYIEKMIECYKMTIEELDESLNRAYAVKEVYDVYEEYLIPFINLFMEIKNKMETYLINSEDKLMSDEQRSEIVNLIQTSFKGESIGIERFLQ
jgi:hypothetical protein